MIPLLLAALLLAEPPGEVVVQKGETLDKVAKRALGNDGTASELKAFNALESDKVAPGTTLKLPGTERARALAALAAARNAVRQAGAAVEKKEDAAAKLKIAEDLFRDAKYKDAAKAADDAWQLVSQSKRDPTQFAIEVGNEGETRVVSRSGKPVAVEAQGVAQPVYPGQELKVKKGEAPPAPETPTILVKLTWPDEGKMVTPGPAPIFLKWETLPDAVAYEVQIASLGGGKTVVLKADKGQLKLPTLTAGKYRWTVRAELSEGGRSAASERTFEMAEAPVKLEVETKWK